MVEDSKNDQTSETETAHDRANARLDEARSRFESISGGLGGRVKSLSDTARKRGTKLSRHGAAIGQRAIATATSASRQANERYGHKVVQLHQGYVQARDRVESWSDDVADYVRAHPGRAVLGAIFAGFVFGLLSRRRSS